MKSIALLIVVSVSVFLLSVTHIGAVCQPLTSGICSSPKVICSNTAGGVYCCDEKRQCDDLPAPGGSTQVGPLNFNELNQSIFGGQPKEAFTTPRGIISYLLPYLFTFAGLILFVMIIWGGFEMLTGAANPKSQESGRQRITFGILGFLIIFAAYWIAQLLQTIFGISILG